MRGRLALRRLLVAGWLTAGPAVAVAPAPAAAPTVAQRAELEQVWLSLAYVSADYGNAVRDGRVISREEEGEMRAYSALARDRVARLKLAGPDAAALRAALAGLAAGVARRESLAAIRGRVESATGILGRAFGVAGSRRPAGTPDLAEGERVFRQNCAVCHGVSGNGRGPAAAALKPAPANFIDPDFVAMSAPTRMFEVASLGVAGSAMPAWHGQLSDRELWNAVLYAWTLHLDPAAVARGRKVWKARRKTATVPAPEAFLAATEDELAAALPAAWPDADRRDAVSWLRSQPGVAVTGAAETASPGTRATEAIAAARAALADARRRYAAGDQPGALQAAADAYLDGFERVEHDLAARDPGLLRTMEERFGALREAIQGGQPASAVDQAIAGIEDGLKQTAQTVGTEVSGAEALGQSFVIILREGFEIMLVLAALATYLIRVGQSRRTVALYAGAGAAVIGSLGLAWLAELFFRTTPASQELLEGVTMLVAAGVLFWVSNWILGKIEAEKWNRYIRSRAEQAVKAGSAWALAGLGFLVVFREGVETVLFYESLSLSAPGAGHLIWLGFGLGCIALVFVSIAIFQLGLRLPLRPFFVATGALLYLMVFTFTGRGIHELQEGGFVPATSGRWLPGAPILGVFPTVETWLPQLALIGFAVFGLWRVFALRGRPSPNTGTVQPTPAHEQLLAIQRLATELTDQLERANPPETQTAARAMLAEWRNLARQIQAATRAGPRNPPPSA